MVVGHIVLDRIRHGDVTNRSTLGGPCVYASLAARAVNSSVAVVSTIGRDFGCRRISWLRAQGISVQHVRVARCHTTRFEIDYQDSARTLKVVYACDPIEAKDVLRAPPASAIHIGPVVSEIAPSLIERLAKRDAIISLDPQGYLRRLKPDGSVGVKKWRDSELLKKVGLLKVSEDEFAAMTGRGMSMKVLPKIGSDIVLITRGARGSVIWSRDEGLLMIPAYRTRVVDPTGAGDAMAGSFLVTWNRTRDLVWSAAVGSAVASFVVEKLGPKSFGTSRQIENRAQMIFEQSVRL